MDPAPNVGWLYDPDHPLVANERHRKETQFDKTFKCYKFHEKVISGSISLKYRTLPRCLSETPDFSELP